MLLLPDMLNWNNIISDVKPLQSRDFFSWGLILQSLYSLHCGTRPQLPFFS